MAQCMHILPSRRPGRQVVGPPSMKLGLEVIAEHIVRFSLAGIRDMRNRIDSGDELYDRE